MPFLDVSDLIDDPDFSDTITVKRSTATVGANGRSTFAEVVTPDVVAVVTSADGENLSREPDGRMAVGGIMIHTKFRLVPGDGAIEADVIVWNGKEYTIDVVNDYSRYGDGFISAGAKIRTLT